MNDDQTETSSPGTWGFLRADLSTRPRDGDSLAIVPFVPFVDGVLPLLWRESFSSMNVAEVLIPVHVLFERGTEMEVGDVILIVDTFVGRAADIEVSIMADLPVCPVL